MQVGEVRVAEPSDFDKLYTLATELPTENGWELSIKKSHCSVYTKVNDISPFKMIRVSADFPSIPASVVYNCLHDSKYRKTWDRNMVESREICVLDANNDIGYYQIKTPGPLKNRDFLTQRSWTERSDCYMIMNHSVYHKAEPPRSNVIRGISYYTGYLIEIIDEKSSRVTYMSQSDPGGKLAKWLVNKLTTVVAPKVVQRIHKACKGYTAWKKKNNPDYMPWLWPDQITADFIDWDDVENTGQENVASCTEEIDDTQTEGTFDIDEDD